MLTVKFHDVFVLLALLKRFKGGGDLKLFVFRNCAVSIFIMLIATFKFNSACCIVLYGCKNWPLALREEHRSRLFENRVLRRIFGPKRDEVTEERLGNGELNDVYSSPNFIRVIKSRRMRRAGHVACMGDRRGFGGET